MRLRARPIWLVLLLACGPSAGTEVGNPTFACGGTSTAAGSDGDGRPADCDPEATPTVHCGDPTPCDVLDFGDIAVSRTGERELVVAYDGCGSVEVSPPELEGRIGIRAGPSVRSTLASGDQLAWTLGFTPIAPGPTGGEIRLILWPGGEVVLPWVGTGR